MSSFLRLLSIPIYAMLLVACESDEQRETRVRAILDAQLPRLEACAQLYDSVIEASDALDAAAAELDKLDHFVLMEASAELDKKSNAFFACMEKWEAVAVQALDEAELIDQVADRAWRKWISEQWQRLGLDRQLAESN